MTTVLKLGGSVLTVKDEPETVDRAKLNRAAAAVADAVVDGGTELVVVHGGGSFGHHYADRYGISPSDGTHDAGAIRTTHGAMRRLDDRVITALSDRDVPALPVHPLSTAHRDRDGTLALPTGQVATMLAEGFLPVLHGDVVAHAGRGATVVSGDELVVALADALGAERVGLCTAVPGVLDEAGTVIDRIGSFDDVAAAVDDEPGTDVTGGMAGKVRALLALEMPATIFDLDNLAAFLAGESPGTRVD